MKLINEYLEVLFENKSTTLDKQIVFEIVSDMTNRQGLSWEWEQISEEIQEEIIQTWIDIVNKHLNEFGK